MSPSELLPALPFKLAQRGLRSCLLTTKKSLMHRCYRSFETRGTFVSPEELFKDLLDDVWSFPAGG